MPGPGDARVDAWGCPGSGSKNFDAGKGGRRSYFSDQDSVWQQVVLTLRELVENGEGREGLFFWVCVCVCVCVLGGVDGCGVGGKERCPLPS